MPNGVANVLPSAKGNVMRPEGSFLPPPGARFLSQIKGTSHHSDNGRYTNCSLTRWTKRIKPYGYLDISSQRLQAIRSPFDALPIKPIDTTGDNEPQS